VDLILISQSKLKIMLTADDMAEYSLSCDNINYDNTETRRAFWDILDTAKHKTGFDAASDRVYIQVYPSKGGGCEMYVTKLHFKDGERHEVPLMLSSGSDSSAFRFDTLEDLLACCRRLDKLGYSGFSWSGYSINDKKYYLILTAPHNICLPALEYGERITSKLTLLMSGEYCKTICEEDAVRVMSKL